ncbi:unnamed protein product [Protopolystoma xenopodis]|uniref:EF-hand domain-containing protein n=1 Tax=Protopolystoma xenopodis TaxID=117903 RepID=A0A3S5A6H0_9PLAT|nr:unnamed protein product [Protopolystoma xenopodis]
MKEDVDAGLVYEREQVGSEEEFREKESLKLGLEQEPITRADEAKNDGELRHMSAAEVKVCKDIFNSVREGNKECIPLDTIGFALQMYGQSPSKRDIEEIFAAYREEDFMETDEETERLHRLR